MTIYKVLANDEKLRSLIHSKKKESWSDYYFDGKTQKNWTPIIFKWHSDKLEIGDFTLVHDAGLNLAVNERTKKILESILGSDVEYLLINIENHNEPWFLVNVTHIIDNALDLKNSEFRIMRSGQIGAIKKAFFDKKNIPDNRAFIYPQSTNSFMFKGELLKEICAKHELKGLGFFTM